MKARRRQPGSHSLQAELDRLPESFTLWIRRAEQFDRQGTVNPTLFDPLLLLTYWKYHSGGKPVYALVKRVFDFCVGALLLIVCLPILAACAFAMRYASRGPIFFRQLRVGEMGRVGSPGTELEFAL